MPEETQNASESRKERFIPRTFEMEAFRKVLPTEGARSSSNRVFNIWGDKEVGKSTFISEFRESEIMAKEKVLWLQPTRKGKLDTIPEFIRACAETIRYPAEPKKEKKIAEQLESVQRGKVNPIVSDDSLLITRSTVAKQKKPYVNQAAAASVGRTEVVRDDAEINVGLGESKASNHAEAFLDALPLQSLGTNLSIIYIERYQDLSVSITDWLRDYVFPAASHGAYRRSVILLLESADPLRLAYPTEGWGMWGSKTEDIQLPPYSEADTYAFGIHSGLEPSIARVTRYLSIGYPAATYQTIRELLGLNRDEATALLDGLPAPDQLKVAALSLPRTVHRDELPILFGAEKSDEIFNWFKELLQKHITLNSSGNAFELDTALRAEALRRFAGRDEFKPYAQAWAPMARTTRRAPSRTDRSRLLLLSGVRWIDEAFCQQLFGEQAQKITPFITQEGSPYFNRKLDRYRISERIRPDLVETAKRLNHPGMGMVQKKAALIWQKRLEELNQTLAELNARCEEIQKELRAKGNKQREVNAQLRIHEREESAAGTEKAKPGLLSKLFSFADGEAGVSSAAGLRKLSTELAATIKDRELTLESLQQQQQAIKDELSYPAADPPEEA